MTQGMAKKKWRSLGGFRGGELVTVVVLVFVEMILRRWRRDWVLAGRLKLRSLERRLEVEDCRGGGGGGGGINKGSGRKKAINYILLEISKS